MRSVGLLVAVFFITRGLHHLHPRPVRIQFIRHDSRQRRPAPASHLRAVCDDVRGSIGVDCQVYVWLQRPLSHRIRHKSVRDRAKHPFRHQADTQHKSSSSEHALEESPPAAQQVTIAVGNVDNVNHALSPRWWTNIAERPLSATLHPTAKSFSCKPGSRQECRADCPGVKRFHASQKCRVAIFGRTVQSKSRQSEKSCPQTSCGAPLRWPWKMSARAAAAPSLPWSSTKTAFLPKARTASLLRTIRRRMRKSLPSARLAVFSVIFNSLAAISTRRASLAPCALERFTGRAPPEFSTRPPRQMPQAPVLTTRLFMTN